MPVYLVHGFGRDTNRRRRRRYQASNEGAAIMKAGDDGTIVERVEWVADDDPRDALGVEVRRAIDQLAPYGVSIDDAIAMRDELRDKFGQSPSGGDVAWGLIQGAKSKVGGDASSLTQICYLAAEFLRGEGRDHRGAHLEATRMQIAECRSMGVASRIKVRSAPGCCDACRAQDGLIMTIEDALKRPPVPCDQCTTYLHEGDKYPWCRCGIAPVLDDL